MKCFVVVAALVASVVAEADPLIYASGAPLLGGLRGYAAAPFGGAIKTITPLGAPIARTYAVPSIAARTIAAPAIAPIARTIAAPLPAVRAIAPVVGTSRIVAAPAGVVSSQYHKQDELKNYEFGYSNPLSTRSEAGNALTGVQGSFSYTDGFGLKHQRNYVADAYGFRVLGSDVPVATGRLHKRSVHVAAPAPLNYGLPWNYGYGLSTPYAGALRPALSYPAYAGAYAGAYAAPTVAAPVLAGAYAAPAAVAAPVAVGVSAPAAREAILTKIQLNPGHATAYRVFEDQGAY